MSRSAAVLILHLAPRGRVVVVGFCGVLKRDHPGVLILRLDLQVNPPTILVVRQLQRHPFFQSCWKELVKNIQRRNNKRRVFILVPSPRATIQ